jgi:hypothetical protein
MSQRLKDRLVDAVLAVVGSLFILFGTGAWSSKENAAEHKADIQAVGALHRADIQELRELQQRTLDAVCDAVKVKPRTCTEPHQ